VLDTAEDEKRFLYAVDSLPESLAGHLVSYQRSGRVGNSIPERVKRVKALLKSFSLTDIEQVLREKKPFILRRKLDGIKKLPGRIIKWNRCALSVSITWA
jgi:hypothetical protein